MGAAGRTSFPPRAATVRKPWAVIERDTFHLGLNARLVFPSSGAFDTFLEELRLDMSAFKDASAQVGVAEMAAQTITARIVWAEKTLDARLVIGGTYLKAYLRADTADLTAAQTIAWERFKRGWVAVRATDARLRQRVWMIDPHDPDEIAKPMYLKVMERLEELSLIYRRNSTDGLDTVWEIQPD